MAKTNRERVVSVAGNLFYRDGFHSIGLDRILREAGITKTTFYNHFESKDALILEVLRAHDRWWRDEFQQLLKKHGGDSPAAQLRAIWDGLDELFASDAFNGCIFVNVAVEFPLPHDPIHQAAAEHKQLMEMILRDLGLRARASDPVALAEELSILMEGAYVTRQVTGNHRTGDIARRAAETVYDKYLPAAG